MTSMGMDKSGTQTIPGSTWTKVITWVVRSGYPGTVITSDTLVMDVTGTGNIRWRGQFGGAFGTQQFRVVKNGTTVVGAAVAQSVTGTASGISMAPGDTLELQAFQSNGTFPPYNAVQPGAAVTFLEWNQVTSAQTFTASADVPVNGTATVSRGQSLGATADVPIQASADLHVAEHHTLAATADVPVEASATLLRIPIGAAPPALGGVPETNIQIHTVDGREIGVIRCTSGESVTWGREAKEVSTAELSVYTQADMELIEDLRNWVHWATIWEDDTPVWTGPILKIVIGKQKTSIACRDPAIFQWWTRVGTTRTWVDTAPARVAADLWADMYELHGYRVTPTVLPGAADSTFTLSAKADSQMLNQLMGQLVSVGLDWTVVAGRPVLGTFSTDPVAELQECDFLVELERLRDGSRMFNDVRVQGQNWAQTAIADLAGLHLQKLVSLDDLRGVSNIQRAAQQYAQEGAAFREIIEVPGGATLDPGAPIAMADLIPGKAVLVHAANTIQPMRIDQVTVSTTAQNRAVQVTLVAIPNTGELATLVGTGGIS